MVARLGVSPKLSYFWSVLQKRTIILYSCPCLHLNHFCSQGVPGGAERGLEVFWQDWWSILIVNTIGSLEALVYPTGTIYFSRKPDSFQPPSSSSFMNVLNSEHEGFCLSCSFTGLAARLRSTKTNRNVHFFLSLLLSLRCVAEEYLYLQNMNWTCKLFEIAVIFVRNIWFMERNKKPHSFAEKYTRNTKLSSYLHHTRLVSLFPWHILDHCLCMKKSLKHDIF